MTSSLLRATSTVDALTAALAETSRAQTPELPDALRCCCARPDCVNLRGWLRAKSKLESRLVLSAGALRSFRAPINH